MRRKYIATIRDHIENRSFDVYFFLLDSADGTVRNLLFERMSTKEYERRLKAGVYSHTERCVIHEKTMTYVELSDLYIINREATDQECYQQIEAMCEDEEWSVISSAARTIALSAKMHKQNDRD